MTKEHSKRAHVQTTAVVASMIKGKLNDGQIRLSQKQIWAKVNISRVLFYFLDFIYLFPQYVKL